MRSFLHPEEFVVLDPMQRRATDAPLGYTPRAPWAVTEPSGTVLQRPAWIGMLPSDPGEPQRVTVLRTVVTVNGEEWTQQVWSGSRTGLVTRWRTTCRVGGKLVFDLPWLAQGGEAGTGNGLNLDEQQHEHWTDPLRHVKHDPTMGGAGQVAYLNPATPQGDHLRLYGGAPIHYRASGGVHQACVMPQEFSAGNVMDGEVSDHGGDDFHPVLRVGKRMWMRLRLNYQGRPCVHKVDCWSYDRLDWTAPDALYYLPLSMACIGRTFDRGYYFDVATQTMTELPGFAPPSDAVIWPKAWDANMAHLYLPPDDVPVATTSLPRLLALQRSTMLRRSRRHRALHAAAARGIAPGASPMPSGYGAAVIQRSADGFCVALVSKLVAPTDTGTGTTDDMRFPAMFDVDQNLWATGQEARDHAGGEFNNANVILQVFAKTEKQRLRGWLGLQAFIYTGRFDQLGATLRDVKSTGAMDAQVESSLPSEVRAGT